MTWWCGRRRTWRRSDLILRLGRVCLIYRYRLLQNGMATNRHREERDRLMCVLGKRVEPVSCLEVVQQAPPLVVQELHDSIRCPLTASLLHQLHNASTRGSRWHFREDIADNPAELCGLLERFDNCGLASLAVGIERLNNKDKVNEGAKVRVIPIEHQSPTKQFLCAREGFVPVHIMDEPSKGIAVQLLCFRRVLPLQAIRGDVSYVFLSISNW